MRLDALLVGYDAKRLHVFTSMYRRDDAGSRTLVATAEHMLLHVDTVEAHASPAGDDVLGRLAEIARAHAGIPRPEQVGRYVGQRR